MNKEGYVKELAKRLDYDLDYSRKVSNIIEENFNIGKNNKEKLINALISELDISYDEADKIYNTHSSIFSSAIKNKIMHPFKKDN